MSVTDGIGQTPCSLEHYLVRSLFGTTAANGQTDTDRQANQ